MITKRLAGFLAVVVALLAGNIGPIRAALAIARDEPTASHIALVPLVSAALLLVHRRAIVDASRFDWAGGIVLAGGVVGSIATHRGIWTPVDPSLTVAVAALVVSVIGAFVLFFGREASRAAAFPLLFLAFAIPAPNVALSAATQVLKRGSAEAVSALFTLTATPYFRDGFSFSLPAFTIVIADECSGIRSSIALMLTMLVAGHLFLDRGWTKTVLLLVVLPIAILKNAIRIVTLSLLAARANPGFLTGQLHHEGGFVFFIMALAIVFPILSYLRTLDGAPQETVTTA
jgi:exosortase